MKKSVIILIGIIYLASVVLVNFYGMEARSFNPVVYTESIELLNDDIELKDDGTPYAVIEGADADGLWHYQVQYRITPDDVTDTTVDYTLLSSNPNVTIDEENNIITFEKRGMVTIMLTPRDGADVSIILEIWAR